MDDLLQDSEEKYFQTNFDNKPFLFFNFIRYTFKLLLLTLKFQIFIRLNKNDLKK